MPENISTDPAPREIDQTVALVPTLRIRITRTPEAVVLRGSRRSPNSTDPDDWIDDARGLVVPLEHVGELVAAIETAARGAP